MFATKFGALDFIGAVSGKGYSELLPDTIELVLGGGLKICILNLETLIEVKSGAGRPKDMAMLPVLRQTLAERGGRPCGDQDG